MPYKPPDNPWIASRRAERRRQQHQWKRDHPLPGRARARKAVEQALRDGSLKQIRCEVGGPDCAKWPTTFHHHSYEAGRELDGLWACWPCHRRLHALERRQERRERLQEQAESLSEHAGVIIVDD